MHTKSFFHQYVSCMWVRCFRSHTICFDDQFVPYQTQPFKGMSFDCVVSQNSKLVGSVWRMVWAFNCHNTIPRTTGQNMRNQSRDFILWVMRADSRTCAHKTEWMGTPSRCEGGEYEATLQGWDGGHMTSTQNIHQSHTIWLCHSFCGHLRPLLATSVSLPTDNRCLPAFFGIGCSSIWWIYSNGLLRFKLHNTPNPTIEKSKKSIHAAALYHLCDTRMDSFHLHKMEGIVGRKSVSVSWNTMVAQRDWCRISVSCSFAAELLNDCNWKKMRH